MHDESNHEEAPDKHKLREVLHNNSCVNLGSIMKQGEIEEMFYTERYQRDMTSKCSVEAWTKSFCYKGPNNGICKEPVN